MKVAAGQRSTNDRKGEWMSHQPTVIREMKGPTNGQAAAACL